MKRSRPLRTEARPWLAARPRPFSGDSRNKLKLYLGNDVMTNKERGGNDAKKGLDNQMRERRNRAFLCHHLTHLQSCFTLPCFGF